MGTTAAGNPPLLQPWIGRQFSFCYRTVHCLLVSRQWVLLCCFKYVLLIAICPWTVLSFLVAGSGQTSSHWYSLPSLPSTMSFNRLKLRKVFQLIEYWLFQIGTNYVWKMLFFFGSIKIIIYNV
jgi:hypothetical protein